MSAFEWETFTEQLEYLKKRGIDEVTLKRLGLEIVGPTRLKELGFSEVPGIQRGILWTLPDTLKTGRPPKYGARLFYSKGFISNENKPKFMPPKGQIPSLYFSPLDSKSLEYGDHILICESYLKADIACLLGFHAIGVSGCWGWSYKGELNHEFMRLPWREKGLVPVVCMDANVCPEAGGLTWQAALKFRAEMEVRCGVDARILVLPGGPECKDGLDDFYVREGREATITFLSGEPESIPNEVREHLKIMNTEVCVVRDIGKFVDIRWGTIMGRSHFEDVNYAARRAMDAEGKIVQVAKIWSKWDGRNEVDTLLYRPGAARFGMDEEGRRYFNLWEKMKIEPKEGDVSLFLSWVDDVFCPTDKEFFLNWWSWQLKNLGGKLATGLVVVGAPGIGKGWMTYIAENIWGIENIAKVPLTALEGRFNAEIAAKQLFIVEESDEIGGGTVYNKLKDMITSTTIRLERKGMDAIMIENHVNVFLTGNQVGIFRLDHNDRRFAVLEASNEKKIANVGEYWKPRWDWIREGGAAAVYAWLLKRDLKEFDPYAEAPMTQAKQDMVELTHEPLEQWVQDHMVKGEQIEVGGIPVGGRVISAKEAVWCFYDGKIPMDDLTKRQIMQMNSALKNARIPVANGGGKIKGYGVSSRYFLLKGPDKSDNWTKEVEDRVFWKSLVASLQGRVASESSGGNQKSKF